MTTTKPPKTFGGNLWPRGTAPIPLMREAILFVGWSLGCWLASGLVSLPEMYAGYFWAGGVLTQLIVPPYYRWVESCRTSRVALARGEKPKPDSLSQEADRALREA